MKKLKIFISVIVIFVVIVTISFSCSEPRDDVTYDHNILMGFSSKERHCDSSFRYEIEYSEYHYINNNSFCNNDKYKKVTSDDVVKLNKYLEEYSHWIVYEENYKDWFTFDYKTQVKEDDYFLLITSNYDSVNVYDDFDIYYFDNDTLTLYYFHNIP